MKKFQCELRSWDDMWNLSKEVAKKIRNSGYRPDFIIGVTRGGWVPAMNLSDLLGIKDLLALKVEHWGITATETGKAELKFPLNIDLSGKKILLVDDLTDTGESIKLCIDHIRGLNPEEIKTATLMHKIRSKFEPDFYAERIEEWRWIIFPWNITEDLCNLIDGVMREQKVREVETIRNALKDTFDLDVGEEMIREILRELRYRTHL